MVASLRSSERGTRNRTGKFAVEGFDAGKSTACAVPGVKSDLHWFADMVQAEHSEKPGTILHLYTGVDERLCQKYAARSVRPSSSFLRALLRTENGWNYLNHIMAGSDAPWWVELQACLASLSQFVK